MNILSVDNLSKSFGDKILFESISFGIAKGEKIALIAGNGTGKTSLLKILAGKETPDTGSVTFRSDLKVEYLEQDPEPDPSKSIIESIFDDSNPNVRLLKRYELLLDRLEDDPSLQREVEEISSQIDNAGIWDYETRIRQILSQLNIHHLDQPVGSLSGGQKKRIALAKVLIEPADLLILDEPTNHLDIEMVEWLEDFLTRSTLSILMVTHDRYFLDNITNKILEIENKKLFMHEGNYSYFLQKKTERIFIEERETEKAAGMMKTELEWMRRMPKARGTKSKARIDAFYELKDKATGRVKDDALSLDIKMNRIGGKVLEMKKVYKSYGELKILSGFDYTFRSDERIGIVGKNGSGKTTFLNLITQNELPDSGKINVGETIVYGYYSQQGLQLKTDKRVIEIVNEYADVIRLSDGTKVSASQFLQLFRFPPNQQHTWYSALSGGEKRRLYLLTVLIRNPNFLILDEPTNDLDLLTLQVLEEFLLHYKGCLIVVSHDRYFMNKIVDHLFIFEGEGVIRDYNGTYTEYRDEASEKEKPQKKPFVVKENSGSFDVKKKLSFREKMEFENLGKEIESLEKEKNELTESLYSGTLDHNTSHQKAERLREITMLIDEKSHRWLELSELA